MTAKADRIKELLSDPLFQEALENTRQNYRDAMENPSVADEDVLELRRMLFLIDRVEKDLENSVQDGELEDLRAEEDGQPSFLGDLWNSKTMQ